MDEGSDYCGCGSVSDATKIVNMVMTGTGEG